MSKAKHSSIDELNNELAKFARIYQMRNRHERLAFGLSVSQTNALFLLAEHGESTVGPIAAQLSLSLSALTKIMDELVSKGIVKRVSDSADGRATKLIVTAKGRRTHEDIRSRFVSHLTSELSDVSAAEIERMAAALRKISTVICEWQAIVRADNREQQA